MPRVVSTVVHSENISIVGLVETKRQYGLRIYSRVIHAMKVSFAQGQRQGQGLDLQGQGLKICPRGHLKAKDNNSAEDQKHLFDGQYATAVKM